jgi:hypothetical protein
MPVKEHYAEVKRNPAGWFLQDGAGGSNKKNTEVSFFRSNHIFLIQEFLLIINFFWKVSEWGGLFFSENMGIISASLITIKPRAEMYHSLNSAPNSFENLIHPRSVHHVYVSDIYMGR